MSRGGQKHAPRSYRIWSSYVGADGIMPDYGYSSPSAGNPAWPSIVLLLGVPALVMDPEMGLWPRDGSTHPLRAVYHRCCRIPPGLLTNNMNFCRLFLFPVLFPFNFNSISLSLSIFRSHFPSSHPKFRHLKGPNTGHPLNLLSVLQRLVPWGHYSPFFCPWASPLLPQARSFVGHRGRGWVALFGQRRDTPLVGTVACFGKWRL